ncbi:MAG: hypothetical protein DRQ54_08380, partial [Gammaproteobacteria bacterium]
MSFIINPYRHSELGLIVTAGYYYALTEFLEINFSDLLISGDAQGFTCTVDGVPSIVSFNSMAGNTIVLQLSTGSIPIGSDVRLSYDPLIGVVDPPIAPFTNARMTELRGDLQWAAVGSLNTFVGTANSSESDFELKPQ